MLAPQICSMKTKHILSHKLKVLGLLCLKLYYLTTKDVPQSRSNICFQFVCFSLGLSFDHIILLELRRFWS